MGKKLLNNYYSATDHSELYHIAMGEFSHGIAVTFTRMTYILNSSLVLHPSHKLVYFQQAEGEKEWRVTAEQIIQAEFERTYASIEIGDPGDNIVSAHFYGW
jgi:hypothetical protein